MVQMQITSPTEPGALPPVVWNYEQVKADLEEKLQSYQGRVYTPETMTAAKADRATLNKLTGAIAAKRREVKAQYLQPYEEFDRQCRSIEQMVARVADAIDVQIKAQEAAEAEAKRGQIEALYRKVGAELCEFLPMEALFNPRWLNKTYRLGAIEAELTANFTRIRDGIRTIRETCGQDTDACLDTYLRGGLDLPAAIAKHHDLEEMRRKRAEHSAPADAQRYADLRASLTGQDAPQPAAPALREASDAPAGNIPATLSAAAEAADGSATGAARYLDLRVFFTDPAQLKELRKFMVTHRIRFCRIPTNP